MSQPQIIAHKDGGMSFVGPAAVDVYRITMLASSIKMYAACGIIPTRGVTITRMLADGWGVHSQGVQAEGHAPGRR
jgi:hypothetical protein